VSDARVLQTAQNSGRRRARPQRRKLEVMRTLKYVCGSRFSLDIRAATGYQLCGQRRTRSGGSQGRRVRPARRSFLPASGAHVRCPSRARTDTTRTWEHRP
jgi:hypothetical protein